MAVPSPLHRPPTPQEPSSPGPSEKEHLCILTLSSSSGSSERSSERHLIKRQSIEWRRRRQSSEQRLSEQQSSEGHCGADEAERSRSDHGTRLPPTAPPVSLPPVALLPVAPPTAAPPPSAPQPNALVSKRDARRLDPLACLCHTQHVGQSVRAQEDERAGKCTARG